MSRFTPFSLSVYGVTPVGPTPVIDIRQCCLSTSVCEYVCLFGCLLSVQMGIRKQGFVSHQKGSSYVIRESVCNYFGSVRLKCHC